ncbi:MAG: excisionase family DNA-binding protein [Hylemonella sp.]|jgi:excisionase family DNA binding protein|nr:excisionase family DNA-binding protein [Hylemonella sp.]MDP1936360.1 excisionase family DNA-binding protein [Hylemonella sp.]
MRKTPANDDLMTTREAGEVLGVAVRTVQLWVESGVLPAWRTAGGHRRIARSAVDKLIAERSQVIAQPVVKNEASVSQDRPLKLLVVEDDADLLNLFTMVVDGWDFPVELSTAVNGFEGLVRIGQVRPDMVVTDLNMPGMDGLQMVRSLKRPDSGYEDLVLIVVTALSAGDIADRGGLPEGTLVFQKPVPFQEIEAIARGLQPKQAAKA